MIPTSEEECDDGVCENPDQLPPVERITLLQQVFPLSQDMDAIGCKLDNEHLKGIARHLSEYVREQSTIYNAPCFFCLLYTVFGTHDYINAFISPLAFRQLPFFCLLCIVFVTHDCINAFISPLAFRQLALRCTYIM